MAAPKSAKTIFASGSTEVWLRIGKLSWSNLSLTTKQRLQRGLEQIAALREAIGRGAKVQTMPPVQIVPEVWRTSGSLVDGRACLLNWNGHVVFGAEIPVNTALSDDQEAVRLVLVHEFCHCFYLQMDVYLRVARGETQCVDDFDVSNADHDAARLAEPSDWLGDGDATSIALHGNERLGVFDHGVPELAKLFPVVVLAGAGLTYSAKSLSIADDVIARITELEKRAAAKAAGPKAPRARNKDL